MFLRLAFGSHNLFRTFGYRPLAHIRRFFRGFTVRFAATNPLNSKAIQFFSPWERESEMLCEAEKWRERQAESHSYCQGIENVGMRPERKSETPPTLIELHSIRYPTRLSPRQRIRIKVEREHLQARSLNTQSGSSGKVNLTATSAL